MSEILQEGTVIGGTYKIIKEIGSGGGGIVYRARHLRLDTDVVVKKIKDDVIGMIDLRQEADILKKLKHPYLPRVYDFIETDDGVYTVMDYIDGENLESAVKRHGKFNQKIVLKWAKQLGEALAYLHSQKPPIIHSDIKPANIMLTSDGNVCLIDFNIALAISNGKESAVGISLGFSPPEQYTDAEMYASITNNYSIQDDFTTSSERRGNTMPTELSSNSQSNTEVTAMSFNSQSNTEVTAMSSDSQSDTEVTAMSSDSQSDTEVTAMSPNRSGNTEVTAMSPSRAVGTGKRVAMRNTKGQHFDYTSAFGRGINARSDIYSLGMTLYYLLTEKKPLADFSNITPLEKTGVKISEGFLQVLKKMTALMPEQRYANGMEYLKAVRSCYKLDIMYIRMHRKELCIRLSVFASLFLGILLVFTGFYRMELEKNSEYYKLISQAEELAGSFDYDGAVLCLSQAKELYSERIDAYEKEMQVLYQSHEYERCIQKGEEYLNTIPFEQEQDADKEKYANLHYIIGNAYYEIDDYANAELYIGKALQYYGGNGLFYRDYAIVLAKLGRVEAAKKELEKGIEKGITEDAAYMVQGEIANAEGRYEDASANLRQTIAMTEDADMKKRAIFLCVDVYRNMGEAYIDEEISLLEGNIGQYDSIDALAMTEYLADAYARKARIDMAYADEYYNKALEMFQNVYESGYDTYQIRQNIAIIYENLNRFDEAQEVLTELSQDYPQRYEIYKRLAFLEADKQQMEKNADRDYGRMMEYYSQAKEKYAESGQDMEMDMLDTMVQELKDGGWLEK